MSIIYSQVFKIIDKKIVSHSPKSLTYNLIKKTLNFIIELKKKNSKKINTYYINDILKNIRFKRYDFVAFKSEDLMNLEELIMMKYYFNNRKYYKTFLDLGANVGLHSVIASKLGFKVDSYEPDKSHFQGLKENCKINNLKNIKINNKAVFNKTGKVTFVQVKNNTTANHIVGLKKNLYGPIYKQDVKSVAANALFKKNDLVKMDIEGAEYSVLKSIDHDYWLNTDCFVSIHNNIVAKKIFNYFKKTKINLFSSKVNWKKVKKFYEMPTCHAEGLLFISTKKSMNWSN
tara:strand:- start:1411 stop:2274 length:864 start_codon:yes stop_codon:yes gene_type:complete